MSRKRISSIISNGLPISNLEPNQHVYFRPGCYHTPQVACQVTPYTQTYYNQWQPDCINATYVVDSYGQVYYQNNLEYQFQVPYVIASYQEISSTPQIEEDCDDLDVSPRKRERLNDFEDQECCATLPILLSHSYNKDRSSSNTTPNNTPNKYRASEGYIVEEPIDNVSDKI